MSATAAEPDPEQSVGNKAARPVSAGGWRVFLSHTSELRLYPASGQSYVDRAEEAVSAAGHVIVDMAYFGSVDERPAKVCEDQVKSSHVYVGIYGSRYGSPVRDKPKVSYTELEFDIATALGIPRLVFVLDRTSQDHRLPLDATEDLKFGQQQAAFLDKVKNSGAGLTVQRFRNPDNLATLVARSLQNLVEELSPSRKRGDPTNAMAAAIRPVPKFLPHLPDRQAQDDELATALLRLKQSLDPLPLVVMLHGEREQAPSTYIERFLAHTAGLLLQEPNRTDLAPTYCELPEPARLAAMAADDWMEYFNNRLLMNSAVNLTLAGFIAARPEPVVIQSSLDPTCWPDGGAALLEQVCCFWKNWATSGGQSSGRKKLIHFIVMSYHKPKRPAIRPSSLRWLFPRYWHYKWRIRRFDRLRRRLDAGIGKIICTVAPDAVALPAFRDVSHDDVLHWLNSEPVRKFLGDADPRELRQQIERLHPPDPQQLVPAPRPMQALADDLYSLLTRYPASR